MHEIGHLLSIIFGQPIFNLLVFITAVLPGHNFGLSIIIFTLLVRILMWPLVKKQLHHTRAMQKLQPELKKIKQAAAGDRQKESKMVMELYKERGMNPLSSVGIIFVQLPIFIALYYAVRKIAVDPHQIINGSYSWLHSFSWMKDVAANIHSFDGKLFGIDLLRHPIGSTGTYIPGLLVAALAGAAQYYQSKQILPKQTEGRKLKDILGAASQGKQADQAEINAAVSRGTIGLVPIMVFVFALNFPTALPFYWFVNSGVAIFQQGKVLAQDEQELEAEAAKTETQEKPKSKKRSHKKHSRKKSRR